METKENNPSIRPYTIALFIAVAMLLCSTAVSYMQINRFQKSADLVNLSMVVDKEIKQMFFGFSLLKTTELEYVIEGKDASLFLLKEYREQSEKSLENLKKMTIDDAVQRENLKKLSLLKTRFLKNLDSVITERKNSPTNHARLKDNMAVVSETMVRMTALKKKMIAHETRSLQQKKAVYNSVITFTPAIILGTALCSLLIFVLAFWKIVKHRRAFVRTQGFLANILQAMIHVVSHFRPLRDAKGNIYDFQIVFTNDQTTAAAGDLPKEMEGRKLSETYPFLVENGVFEILTECIENGRIMHIEREYELPGGKKYFKSTAIKLNDGVVLTSTDVTPEKLSEKRLEELNRELVVKNASLSEAEAIAQIGSYRLNKKTGNVEISDNFFRILGHQPHSFIYDYDTYRTFLHPEDLKRFDRNSKEMLDTKEDSEQNYRIISKDGKVKHIWSNRHLISDQGNDNFVGVVRDMTLVNERKQNLQDQNLELRRSNEELDSFNQVASHDLQEPLRKIQLFISLIQENGNLNSEDDEYFIFINNAAQRMQTLIKHLLAYSRISKDHKGFEPVDLNAVLQKTSEDQSDSLENANMKLTIKEMPIINGVRFQMEQLFNNLISNGIKYRTVDELPKILITAQKVHRSQVHQNFHKKYENYHKITVVDNGIGFDQKHGTMIFELFKRLHHKNEYSGTGLGLAICKKIMENHNGHISTVGEVGSGAAFSIYLPAE